MTDNLSIAVHALDMTVIAPEYYNKQILEITSHKTATVRPPTSYHKKTSKLDEEDMR